MKIFSGTNGFSDYGFHCQDRAPDPNQLDERKIYIIHLLMLKLLLFCIDRSLTFLSGDDDDELLRTLLDHEDENVSSSEEKSAELETSEEIDVNETSEVREEFQYPGIEASGITIFHVSTRLKTLVFR